ncbi:DUF2797 domain-containing protein [Streptomyces sp. H10-C2]|uniref:DUF2797 domain-containing protein n=1 Tax=unclassified Streptomyces TaxID=2593676 RepID=UPI0024BB8E06|nr:MULTISPECIES: DUF2797 domain-containing protein [unclassified Streptomyces]MDJ0342896.1 DUF2797 domain-containing protein [Streptomyces sp. PH10-H1]MDJ0372669.1 DUF2797 domain-containing protein [Streptomyces sp. H10-C2]
MWEPSWEWSHPRYGDRSSPVRIGRSLALAVGAGAVRRCAGVRRAGRHIVCPRATELSATARRDQCDDCAALDQLSSVAADTMADDPRPYSVYLAYFGPGLTKVGITAVERGATRLVEQAAVCFSFLGRGPLMAARRTEASLGAALGIPDRVSAGAKRAARWALPSAGERAAELRALYEAVTEVPDTLERLPYALVDHAELFGLEPDPPRPVARITALAPGTSVTGTVRAVAGSDLYLDGPGGRLLLDARLVSGWPLTGPAPGSQAAAPTAPVLRPGDVPEPLF